MRASADARESRYVSSALVDRCRIAIELLSKALVFLYGLTGERARPAGGLGLLINRLAVAEALRERRTAES